MAVRAIEGRPQRKGTASWPPAVEAGPRRPAWQVVGVCAVLMALVFVVFGQTLGHGFVSYDDGTYVYGNPIVLKGLSIEGLRWALTYGDIGHWHPLTWVIHMLDCNLYGTWAGGHHLTSVIVHAMAAVLLFLVFYRMTGAFWRCGFAVAVWAVHPLRVESVAWVAELKDVLSAFFFALTLGAYAHYVRRPSRSRYALVAVAFALGLLSKNMLVTLPCVLLLLDYWPLGRLTDASRFLPLVREKLPLFVLSAISCAITFLVPEKLDPKWHLPLWLRLENALVSCCVYLRQTLWPAGLALEYPDPTHAFPFWEVAGSLALLGLLSIAAFRLRTRQPVFLFGWLWFIGMLAPVIGIAQISYYAHADRYTYLPQIGLCLGGAWMAADWAGQWREGRWTLAGAALAILCALVFSARQQTAYWRDNETLWTHTLVCTGDNYAARYNLGNALLREGRTQEAIAEFREALRIHPTYEDAHNDLGSALLREGRTQEAISEFREALEIDPAYEDAHNNLGLVLFDEGRPQEAIAEYRDALRVNSANAGAHYNLGNALLELQRADEAIAEFREALRINPAYADAHNNLGNALLQRGRTDEAVAEYRDALRIDPADARAHYNLGIALLEDGRSEEAISQVQQALEFQPANPSIRNKLAWMLATVPQTALRAGARAVELATEASQSTGGGNPDILRTLAAAYAEAGEFPNAVQTAQRALQLGEAQGNTALADALRRELKLYEAGRPYEDVR